MLLCDDYHLISFPLIKICFIILQVGGYEIIFITLQYVCIRVYLFICLRVYECLFAGSYFHGSWILPSRSIPYLIIFSFSLTFQDLSYRLAKQRDHRNKMLAGACRPIPQDLFQEHLFRQPNLTEGCQYPEEYRVAGDRGFLSFAGSKNTETNTDHGAADGPVVPPNPMPSDPQSQDREGDKDKGQGESVRRVSFFDEMTSDSLSQVDMKQVSSTSTSTAGSTLRKLRQRAHSINVHSVVDEIEDSTEVLEQYFYNGVLPLTIQREKRTSK